MYIGTHLIGPVDPHGFYEPQGKISGFWFPCGAVCHFNQEQLLGTFRTQGEKVVIRNGLQFDSFPGTAAGILFFIANGTKLGEYNTNHVHDVGQVKYQDEFDIEFPPFSLCEIHFLSLNADSGADRSTSFIFTGWREYI